MVTNRAGSQIEAFCGHKSCRSHKLKRVTNRAVTRSKKTSKLRVTGLCEGNLPVTGEFPVFTGEFPAQKPVTRNMFPFDDFIMKTGNIDVGDECFSMKCEVSAPP